MPKMVPWTHDNIASSIRAIVAGYRARPAGRDRRGDAAVPRSRAARRVAVHPRIGRDGVAAALAGGSRRTRSGTTSRRSGPPGTRRCPPIHQILLERATKRLIANPTSHTALHPQLQRAAHPGNRASAARRVFGAGGVRVRDDRGDPPGEHHHESTDQDRKPLWRQLVWSVGRPARRSASPGRTAIRCRRRPSERCGCAAPPWCAATSATRR